jgi:hypothetical protein
MEPNRCPWRLDDEQIEVVDDAVAEVLRRKTPAERVAMIGGMNRLARQLLAAQVRWRHPEWSQDQVAAGVARRLARGLDGPVARSVQAAVVFSPVHGACRRSRS